MGAPSPNSDEIEPEPPEGLFRRLRRKWRSIRKPTKVLAYWLGAFIAGGIVLFVWVTARQGVAVAFDVLTQHESPIGSNLGIAGVALSSFGYFLAPAIIGAIVGAVYVSAGQVSQRSIRKQTTDIVHEAHTGKHRGNG